MSVGIAKAAGLTEPGQTARIPVARIIADLTRQTPQAPEPAPVQITWTGVDLDGDGRADLANPTGQAPRGVDAYGGGGFHASRDGGSRRHQGVDYVADAGQAVDAPISGFITRIGYAYSGDSNLKFVEINNPALRLEARVFYIDPQVEVGDAVKVGAQIGKAHSLQGKYPRGITDHVHLEIADRGGRKLDATNMILAVRSQAVQLASR